MTVLSDNDIAVERANYKRYGDGLVIDPFDRSNLQPASYDLTLGDGWLVPVESPPEDLPLWLSDGLPSYSYRQYTADEFVINSIQNPDAPGSKPDSAPFVLGHTIETIGLPDNVTAEIKGRSSVGRMGIIPHTAGWGDPGFSGQITLEFVNLSPNPIVLERGQRIAQVVFSYTESPSNHPYGEKEDSKYQGQTGATESRIQEDE